MLTVGEIQHLNALGFALNVFGVSGDRYSAASEGIIHEIAHIAAIEEFCGWGAQEGLAVMLGAHPFSNGLDRLNDWMIRLYVRHLRIVDPFELNALNQPVWTQWSVATYTHEFPTPAHERADSLFFALSSKLEVHAQAATYLALYRAGLEAQAFRKFSDSAGGANLWMGKYEEMCANALHKPVTGRLASRVESLARELISRSQGRFLYDRLRDS